jgi:hypothetical protein
MLSRKDYDLYLQLFNSKNYDGVLEFFTSDPSISFGEICLRSPAEVRKFYGFFHTYVKEQIVVKAFASSDELLALEVQVELTGLRELDAATARRHGYPGLIGPPVGRTLALPQYIHYRLRSGKFASVNCVLIGEPKLISS